MAGGRLITTTELRVIREHFPKGGASACKQLINRSEGVIRDMAWRYGIKRDQESLLQLRKSLIPSMNKARLSKS